MKILYFLALLTVCFIRVNSQSVLPLRADTVVIEKTGGNGFFKLKDSSRTRTGGILTNIGGGVYVGRKPYKINDTTIVIGLDTFSVGAGGGSGSDIQANVFKDSMFVPLIIIFGESNASGVGSNTFALAGELDENPLVQIMQQSGSFANLNIGANNNITETTGKHGLELELQNLIAAYFAGRVVYTVKAGSGGSAIAQWGIGGSRYDTLITRTRNAINRLNELGKIPVICVWYSQGINDGVAGTDEDTWYTLTLELLNNFRGQFGFCPVLMTQLIGDRVTYPQLDAIDDKIFALARDKSNYIYRIPTPQSPEGSASTDSLQSGGVHWEYVGLKAIAQRMVRAMVDSAGYVNYDRRIRFANLNNWQLTGNVGTNTTDNFIGTRDNVGVSIKTNSTEAVRIDNSQNVGIGTSSPNRKLHVNGDINVNSYIIGRGGGDQVDNLVISNNGLSSNTTGTLVTAVGWGAGNNQTTGFGNTYFGAQAGYNNTTSHQRTCIGWQSGYFSTGQRIITIGSQAGSFLTTEDDRVVIHNTNSGAWLYGNMSTMQAQFGNTSGTPTLTTSAALEVIHTSKGFLGPRHTSAQRAAISSPIAGLEVYDTDIARKTVYNGSSWDTLGLNLGNSNLVQTGTRIFESAGNDLTFRNIKNLNINSIGITSSRQQYATILTVPNNAAFPFQTKYGMLNAAASADSITATMLYNLGGMTISSVQTGTSKYSIVDIGTDGVASIVGDSVRLKSVPHSGTGLPDSVFVPGYRQLTGDDTQLGASTLYAVPLSSLLRNTVQTLNSQYTTAQNSGTSETDMYTYTMPANTLDADGKSMSFEIDGELNDNTATAQIKLYFAGNTTLNTGAVNINTALTAYRITGRVVRTSSTTAHVTYHMKALGLATDEFLSYNNLTSLDFTATNIFKITAQAGGAGGGNGDITTHSWKLLYQP